MQHIRQICGLILLIVLIVSGFAGCGGGDQKSPIVPPTSDSDITPPTPRAGDGSSPMQWGTWIFRFNDETEDNPASVEAIPLRSSEIHVDVGELLKPPICSNCFDLQLMGIIDEDWTIYVEMTNPTVLSAYDVMGIFPAADCPRILQPDSYTDLFDIDGDSETHHPFVVFDTGNPGREWGPGETHGKMLTLHRGENEKFTDLVYVVSASWPENQAEVAEVKNAEVSGPLYTDTSHPVDFSVEVLDWQDDVEYVLIDLEPVNGNQFTHMQPAGDGVWQYLSYAEYGLEVGSETLMIAAKSEGSDKLTYNYLTVNIEDPPPPPSNFEVLSGPTLLDGDGAPSGELDLAVVGRSDGSSSTLVSSSSTTIYDWNEDYTQSVSLLTLIEPTEGDPSFPIEPVVRIGATDPEVPSSLATYSMLLTNDDSDTWDDTTDPVIPYRNTFQLIDLEQMSIIDFKLTADNTQTDELDAILHPIDVCGGVGDDKYGYALWEPDEGSFPGFYPYVVLVRYAPPYKDETEEYDALIGGVAEGSGDGILNSGDIQSIAVWDGGGESELLIAVCETGELDDVEIFTADYQANPGGVFTHVETISGFAGSPVDVAILPVGDAGEEENNWICILTDIGTVEVYNFSGAFVESIYYPDEIPHQVTHLDTDTENLRIHVMMEGPYVTVVQYTGM